MWKLLRFACAAVCVTALTAADAPSPGKNTVTVRGQAQEVWYYPAATRNSSSLPVLFLPGDGGWRGFAIDLAKDMAAAGYDVYGWDIKTYLVGFTGHTGLREPDIADDTHQIATWIAQRSRDKVVLAGWSQGAAMAVLAAASPQHRSAYAGIIALGLPDSGVLGWRWRDDLTYLTKKDPDEPTFPTLPYLRQLSPLPTALIYSGDDEYVSADAMKALIAATGEPKRCIHLQAKGHRYEGARAELLKQMGDAVQWMTGRR
jgi:alpha-beta hydrolase superfamily lysophospholipase